MQYSKWEYQNLALAGIAQCAALVDNLAVRGSCDPNAVSACVNPLLNFSPASVSELISNPMQLSLGLRTLQDIFSSNKADRNPEIIRYLLGILALRQKLMSDSAMQENLQTSLQSLRPPASFENDEDDEDIQHFLKAVAEIYQDTISTYTFRIHVKGNLEHLRNERIASQVRTLLLAGIRWAVLWYQIGGRRWHLVLYRKKIDQTAEDIRRKLLTSV
ncbi:MAG: high frequency lysogenization protein HflD [Gammaproteobacteria bacterium]|nr:high frequency lysogenization protein HflD [Gammaproteobacteria bacterium]